MGTISNDFVTIKYNTKIGERTAKCYMSFFDANKEFYKGLLNGRKVICTNPSMHFVTFINSVEENKNYVEQQLQKTILQLNGVKEENFHIPTAGDIYLDVTSIITAIEIIHSPEIDFINKNKRRIYYELARDYFEKTKDFTYLKKYFFGNQIENNDLIDLCYLEIDNNLDDLLREKIINDRYELEANPDIYENINGILAVLYNMYLKNINKINILQHSKDVFKTENSDAKMEQHLLVIKNSKEPHPKITDEECETLSKEVLTHIDPTNKLLEEYLECKKNNVIEVRYVEPGKPILNQYCHDDKTGKDNIILTRYGTLVDVLNLVHEFSHYHHFIVGGADRWHNILFVEYPSIYFELKGCEYLIKKGYSKDTIESVKGFRTISNLDHQSYACLSLQEVLFNKSQERKDLDISVFKNAIDRVKTLDNATVANQLGMPEEEANKIIESQKRREINKLFLKSNCIALFSRYLLGTYLAEYSINNLKNEDTLTILENVMKKQQSIYSVFKMVGIDTEKIKLKDYSEDIKIKVKSTKEVI